MLFAPTTPPSPLRDYQCAALEAIASHYRDGVQRQLLSLPTGLGKTKIFTSVPERLGFSHDQLTLAVAHTDELVEQTVAAFEQALPAAWIEVEKAGRRALSAASIVVGSVQTLRGRRLRDFFRRFGSRIALLVIDEAHRSIAASYQELVRAFFEHAPRGLLLGVTATPRRSDNVGLDSIYQRIVYHMDIRAAIAQGYLVQIQGFRVGTTTSLEGVASRAGDFAIDQLAARVDTPERNVRIVAAYATKTPGRQAIVFAASVDHARHLAQCFREANIAAEALWGELPLLERRARMESFRRRRLQVLVNFAILVEGVDVPATDVIIMARPTRSGLVYRQALGRGLRPHEDIAHLLGPETTSADRVVTIASSAKPHVTLLDVVDASRRHTLVTLPTLFGMPSQLDPAGRRILDVADTFDQLAQVDPEAAKHVASLDEIHSALEEIDLFAVPQLSRELAGATDFAWCETSEGRYRLSLPRYTVARTIRGELIDDFDGRLRSVMAQCRENGADDPKALAYEMLEVDATSVRTHAAALEVRADPLNQHEVWSVSDGQESKLGTTDDLVDALARAENWVRARHPGALGAISAKAKWRREPTTRKQRLKLKGLGVPKHRIPKNKGDASRLIDRMLSERTQVKEKKQPALLLGSVVQP